ncbi:MAG TPA: CapA family protein [bacterium]|nr:CapA family protein [bacterium]
MTRRALPWWSSLVALALVSALVWAGFFFGSRLIRPARGLQAYGAVTPPPETATTSLVLCGDVMLARGVREKSEAAGDTAWPFRNNLFLTVNADVAFANLESLFSENPDPNPAHLVFQLRHEQVEALRVAGFDAVSLANNHAGNVGRAGMAYTVDLLRSNGIAPSGGGHNLAEAHRPAVVATPRLTFAFCSYAAAISLVATDDAPGHTAWGLDLLREDLARAEGEADVVVVSLHAGDEYAPRENGLQRDFAYAAIDSGADIVVGHHPHVLEPIEIYQGRLICYSLGNYVFDQPWNYDAGQTAAVEVLLRGDEPRRAYIHPLRINADFQPEPVDGLAAEEILRRLGLETTRIELGQD